MRRPTTVRLVDITDEPLSVDAVLRALADPGVGGIALFVGTVRDNDNGSPVRELDYSAHPGARDELRALAERVAGRGGVVAVAAVHRTGRLRVGEPAVVVAVGAAHRAEAFAAARELIDELKATVPIWKHQLFADGTEEWVGLP